MSVPLAFSLLPAESREFARWWAAYRAANEDFSQSYAELSEDIAGVPYCHWIMQDGQRVGGIIKVANNVGDFFLIPPFNDPYVALRAVLPGDDPLQARNILAEHVRSFQMLGFRVDECRNWMLRPTQAYPDVALAFPRSLPQVEQTDQIAELMVAAFRGGAGQYGRRSVDEQRRSVENYFENLPLDSVCHQASSVVFDGDRMIATCLVQPYKAHASIRFVVTDPAYQRRGIARRVIEYAIDTVGNTYDYVALAVTVGNPAMALYHAMGFVAGPVTATLVRGSGEGT